MANKNLKKIVLQVVDNQLRENNPPITKITFERLQQSGYTTQQAKEKISAVLLEEMYDVLKTKQPYNEERYSNKLLKLK
ncbi:hypothetical protein SAMN04515679_1445 [Pelosinus fermentans]|uniref:Uncharacterized protein n=1 Tax=Pelosinus fermentans B4 TaxID=1149862 RepID=I8RNI0_9FIRM|nr:MULTISPECIES: hypothetical protein [Pelosinus]EIW20645.1 hypothetical protein FB4_2264 [Pelosinus fermentans B4]EIW25640.1 hypothetical protein FA11_2262 [Pelosinus fermentans A11]OAM93363.1 hypothetical protein FR7_01379 [Pelosinus fermentans DSM 17108]SDQ75225.1 hypothetical protein SAMN04515679_1445 [Pelosinus fermentans]